MTHEQPNNILKISTRFFSDYKIRALWDDESNKWYFSALDVIGALNKESDYNKCRNYWKYLKAKLKKGNSQVVSATTQLKLISPNGKKYKSDMFDSEAIIKIAKSISNNKGVDFIDWSNVDKKEYLEAMRESVADSKRLKALLNSALTDKINDRDTFLKGIDYSYYYEEILS